jgi:hypothetical protein
MHNNYYSLFLSRSLSLFLSEALSPFSERGNGGDLGESPHIHCIATYWKWGTKNEADY